MTAALSLLFPYLLGLGLLVTLPCLPAFGPRPLSASRLTALLSLVLICGLQLNYLLAFLPVQLDLILALGGILAATGVLCCIALRRSLFSLPGSSSTGELRESAAAVTKRSGIPAGSFRYLKWLAFGYLVVLFAVPIVTDPIAAWDARSIWYFHGKMIYYHQSLEMSAFTQAAVQFSHPDYPKLVPVLAAQLATIAGFWNEYLPKASLLALFVPALLGLFSFAGKRFRVSFLFLVGLFLFAFDDELLWNGLMDGYLALYGGLALLFFARWLDGAERLDFYCCALYLGVVLNLKNEGVLYCLAVAAVSLAAVYARERSLHRFRFLLHRPLSLLPILPALPFLLWSLKKGSWGVKNDLQLGPGSLERIWFHLQQGGLGAIAEALFIGASVWKAVLLLALALLAARFLKVAVPFSVTICVLSSLVYFAGIFVVYLATPADLSWHLETSASRTMLPVILGLFAAAYVVLDAVEPERGLAAGDGGGRS